MNITTEQLSLINGALVHASNHITHLEGMRLKQDCHAIPSVFTLETQQALIKAQEIVSEILREKPDDLVKRTLLEIRRKNF